MKKLITLLCLTFCFIQAHAISSTEGMQTFSKNFHLSPDKQIKLANDIKRFHAASDVWNDLRDEFTLYHYEKHPKVQAQINWFLTHQDFLYKAMLSAQPYLYYIIQQARVRHLPLEVVLLPIFESSYNPFAYSSAGAAGLWQMMPNTATGYGILQNAWYDGRRDLIASTRGALNYLSYLSAFFNGNWLLVFAAYDAGQGNVLNAIRKNIHRGAPADFWSLPLPDETKKYVPRLLALAAILSNPEKYPVYLPSLHNAPFLGRIDVGRQLTLKHAANLAGLSLKKLMALNPGFNRLQLNPSGPFRLVLPLEHLSKFSQNLSKLGPTPSGNIKQSTPLSTTLLANEMRKSERLALTPSISLVAATLPEKNTYQILPGDTIYMTRNGDSLANIAKKFAVNSSEILAANPKFVAENVGTRLVIPTHLKIVAEKGSDIEKGVSTQHPYQLAGGDTVYMVRKGDTLEKIAKRFSLTEPEIRIANLLPHSQLQEGDRLIIPTHIG